MAHLEAEEWGGHVLGLYRRPPVGGGGAARGPKPGSTMPLPYDLGHVANL